MEKENTMEQKTFCPQEEKEITKKAKKRVGFKVHAVIYLLVCLLFWLFWYFVFSGSSDEGLKNSALNVCLFISLTWGICIIAHYLIVYKWNKKLIENEIRNLKKENERKQIEELKHSKQQY